MAGPAFIPVYAEGREHFGRRLVSLRYRDARGTVVDLPMPSHLEASFGSPGMVAEGLLRLEVYWGHVRVEDQTESAPASVKGEENAKGHSGPVGRKSP